MLSIDFPLSAGMLEVVTATAAMEALWSVLPGADRRLIEGWAVEVVEHGDMPKIKGLSEVYGLTDTRARKITLSTKALRVFSGASILALLGHEIAHCLIHERQEQQGEREADALASLWVGTGRLEILDHEIRKHST